MKQTSLWPAKLMTFTRNQNQDRETPKRADGIHQKHNPRQRKTKRRK